MKNNKKKIIKVLIIILFILLLIWAYFVFFKKGELPFVFKPEEKVPEKTEQEIFEEMRKEEESRVIYTFDEEEERRREWNEEDFKAVAKSFAERFGSYSSHGNYENILQSKEFMSKEMKSWADSYVANLKNNSQYSGEYYGMITSALTSPKIEKFNPKSNQVEVLVPTQRFETKGTAEESVFSQDIKIVFIKEGGEWLVNSASWQ